MQTIKRNPPEIDTSIDYTNKFFNQFEFKGIMEPDNIFITDDTSFEDAKNVYVDDGQFVGRHSLQKDIEVPKNAIPYLYDLIDYLVIGDSTLYISQNKQTNNIIINLFNDDNIYTLDNITQYHIATIEHYIICFNNVDAKVFDASTPTEGWQDFDNFVDVPVVKRVVGGLTTEYPKNEFTDSRKEEYIWSNESRPELPDGTGEVVLNTRETSYTLEISDTKTNLDYRILKKLTIPIYNTDLISMENNVICIGRENYFLYSANAGESFTTVYYPEYGGEFLNIASVSKDGLDYFFVATDGVYRCNLGTLLWGDKIRPYNGTSYENIEYSGINNICYFMTKDIFSFITYETQSDGSNKARLYWKGPGLYMGNYSDYNLSDIKMGYTQIDNTFSLSSAYGLYREAAANSISMYISNLSKVSNGLDTMRILVVLPAYGASPTSYKAFYVFGGNYGNVIEGTNTLYTTSYSLGSTNMCVGIFKGQDAYDTTTDMMSSWNAVAYRQDGWYECTILGGVVEQTLEVGGSSSTMWRDDYMITGGTKLPINVDSYIHKLSGGYVFNAGVYSDITKLTRPFPSSINGESVLDSNSILQIWAVGDYFYLQTSSNEIYTNKLSDTDTATITYTYIVDTVFNKIPQVSYSDTELYLAFGDTLQITENNRDGTKILFNLPPKNNQSFITDITAMVNISTTEVAIFFENKIVICSKVTDENFGYRYDYYNTKLSLGVRLGDGVINTLEGSYTIFPTKRGLAIMNYQAFMATTDQTIQYITDDIKELWNKFYKESNVIKIIQWRNNLVFTNGTKDILLYYLVNTSWWRWEVPFNTQIAITDQLKLKLISRGELNVFTDEYIVNDEVKQLKYYDFSANGENIPIEWLVQSQPMHLNAPTFYKNLKQLIFQFFTDNEEVSEATMLAQIKLYRKRIDLKEPSTIHFKIERLRTFVKRFNYWKINELQWGLANDSETNIPARFKLNGISIKYEIGDEVR